MIKIEDNFGNSRNWSEAALIEVMLKIIRKLIQSNNELIDEINKLKKK